MRNALLALSLLACACTPPAPTTAPAAETPQGNRVEAVRERDGQFCTEDRHWCVRTTDDNSDETLTTITHGNQEVAVFRFGKDMTHGVWPRMLRLADGSVIIGLTSRRDDMYSGGGGFQTDVALFRFEPGDRFTEDDMLEPIAALPLAAEFSIRACFDAEDEQARRGACSDDYGFDADITLEEGATETPPPLVISTHATTYPGPRSRFSDSTEAPALGPNDLVTVRDPECSYRRTLYWSSNRYVPDRPLPACENYKTQ